MRFNFVFIFSVSFLLSSCRSIQPAPAPARLSVNASEEEIIEAKNFAKTLVDQKKNGNTGASEIKAPQIKSLKPAKLRDPAWESIQKQKSQSEKVFTLTELIDLAFKNNPQTRQAWENTRIATAVEKQAESALYPQLTISESVTREKILSNLPSVNADFTKVNDLHYGPSAQLTYLLLDFGGRSSRIESTFQKVLEANSLYVQSLQDLILNVQTAYYNYYSSQSLLEAAELDVQNTKTDYEAARQKFDVGLVPQLDVLQAKSTYENSLYNLEDAKGAVKTAKANLALAIGVSAETNIEIVIPSKELPTDISEDDVSSLIDEAIQKRPNIKALRADLNSKKAASRAAFSDLLPTLNLGVDAQQTRYKYYNSGGAKDNQRQYSGVLSVDWDIFDGFNNWNKKKQADYEANAAMDNLIQAELEASSDVWIKYYDFTTAVQKLKYSRSYYETSLTSYDLALESYKAGLKSILDLLQAQTNLSQARSRLVQSKQDVFVALAQLAHSTGTPNIKINLVKDSSGIRGD